VLSCHLFLISSASVRSLTFLSFIVPIFAWSVPLVSPLFLKRSIFFTILLYNPLILVLFTYEDFLISPCYSLEVCINWVYLSLSPLPFTSLIFSAIFKASSGSHLALSPLFYLRMVLDDHLPYNVTNLHPYLFSLTDLIPWIYFSSPLYNHKGFDLGRSWMF